MNHKGIDALSKLKLEHRKRRSNEKQLNNDIANLGIDGISGKQLKLIQPTLSQSYQHPQPLPKLIERSKEIDDDPTGFFKKKFFAPNDAVINVLDFSGAKIFVIDRGS